MSIDWKGTESKRRGREEETKENDRKEMALSEVGKKRWRS